MASPRLCSLSRSLLFGSTRTVSSAFRSTRINFPCRQIVTSSKLRQESVQYESNKPSDVMPASMLSPAQRSKNARSVALMMVSKHATRADVEKAFRDAGLDVKDILMKICRFSFFNNRHCVVELASEQQAQKAPQLLKGNKAFGDSAVIHPVLPDFIWGANENTTDLGHYVFHDEKGISRAIAPLIEGRRIHLSVKTPSWGDKKMGVGERRRMNREVIRRHFSQFGIEAIGPIAPNYGDMKLHPRFLAFVDFTTKRGAEEAIRQLHDTDIEGRKVWLEHADIAPWKAYQIGRVDKKILEELQEKGLAPTDIDEERFSQPYTKTVTTQPQKKQQRKKDTA